MNDNQTTNNASDMNERQSQLATVLIGVLIVVAGFLIYTVFSNQNSLETINDVDLANDTTEQTDSTMEQADESDTTPNEPEGGTTYKVQAGDTLWSIAQKAYGDGYKWREIADANGISIDNTSLDVDQELSLPALGGPSETTTDTNDDAAMTDDESTDTTDEQANEDQNNQDESDETQSTEDSEMTAGESDQMGLPATYTIQHGDTLWSIAQKFYGNGDMWHKIFDYQGNNLSYYTSITSGQRYPIIHAGNVITIPAL
ncbi:LysM peptidoglycan-binding domain-containing protein [candidate division WWE3 bacterium]|uniref:LysM peptidoglycan-binding domain-containing protein n=1 Tax=candidate division WWE3 bacterium TaxID=2053526 RepID=A0A955LHK5_UNCKA|nr:LysM peptidoglycan-binding domain-containing protein [candidate division WWE3 bacterium]